MSSDGRLAGFAALGLCLGAAFACLSLEPLSSYESRRGAPRTQGVLASSQADAGRTELVHEPEPTPFDAAPISGEAPPAIDTSALARDAGTSPAGDAGLSCSGQGEFLGPGSASCYRLVAAVVSAASAATACNAWGGALVEIDSAEEDAFIGSRAAFQFWIGANDRVTEGRMVWNDGASLAYSHWASGQPDDYQGREDCVVKLSPGGLWNDVPCADSNPYVCERSQR